MKSIFNGQRLFSLMCIILCLSWQSAQACETANCSTCTVINNQEVCSKCADGFYLSEINKGCNSCASSCSLCSTLESCLECKGGFFLVQSTGKCVGCIAGCQTCQDASTCQACASGYTKSSEGSCKVNQKSGSPEETDTKFDPTSIVMIVVYAVLGVLFIAFCILFYFYYRRKLKEQEKNRKIFEQAVDGNNRVENDQNDLQSPATAGIKFTGPYKVTQPVSRNSAFRKAQFKKNIIAPSRQSCS